jgi:predicted nucleic acid-binding OB-fold protein
MALGVSEIISIITAFTTIGVVYGTIKTNDKNQSISLTRLEVMIKESNNERKDQIKMLEERMTKKFDEYNGLKERMAVGQRDIKTLWNKFDEICKRGEV